ncbi:DUF1707 domain-containing protein, partial [Actinomadura sp. HBU206391]|uniref:DUF1707 SHOCT-like domain-containing protein n=1 Tax=Actinomadura sp. HBU206391 TaxID=2731692 RepID=UPI00164F5B7E
RLRVASVEGRLTFEDLTERTEAAYGAVTRAELEAVTSDLPAAEGPQPGPPPGHERRRFIAVLGDSRQRLAGRVDERLSAVAVLGDVVLDLRGAHVTGGVVDVAATAVVGNVRIIVPNGVDVQISGIAVLGDKNVRVGAATPGSSRPVVRVHANAFIGDVVVVDDEHTAPVRKALAAWLNRGGDRRL